MLSASRHQRTGRTGRALAVLALALSLTGVAAAPATAGTAAPAFNSVTAAPAVLREAARHAGKSYRYGAVGPAHFDCSGFTMYVFAKFGVVLPHQSGAQRAATVRVPAADRRPGDLVFTHSSSGRVTHVGIYAGNNMMWHSPRTGDVVKHSALF
ncbi:MAG: NlpC/P60 family protein, partial [Mycobacteriales bacterium]